MTRERMIFDVRGLVMAVLCATVVLMAGFERAEAKIPEASFDVSMVSASAVVEVIADAPVRNGDVVQVAGSGFAPNDEIKVVLLTKLNNKNAVPEDIFLKEFSLQVDASGRLSGTVRMEGLDDRDSEAELLPCAERSNVQSSKRFAVVGDMAEPPRRAAKTLTTAGSVTIDDNAPTGDSNGYVGDVEKLNVTGNGDWAGSVAAVKQLEYTTSDGTGTANPQTSLVTHTVSISGGSLTGDCTTVSPNGSTLSMKIRVFNDNFDFEDSNVMEIADSDPPDYTAAETKTPTTIEVTFNEAVTAPSDNSAACDNWTVTDYAMSSLSPLGSSSTTFTLTVTSAFNRGATPDVNFTTGAEEYEDAQGNDAITVTNINTTDGCSPAAPTLTLPVNSTIMGGASVAWTATADHNTTDTSIDGVQLQGSDNGSDWSNCGAADTDCSDTNYGETYAFGTKYKYYRAQAYDGSLVANSSSTNDLADAYRIEITSSPLNQATGVRGKMTVTVQNNYAVATALGSAHSYNLSSTSSSYEFWNASPGGNQITLISFTNTQTTEDFWYLDNNTGSPTVSVNQTAQFIPDGYDEQGQTITSGAVAKLLVQLPGQSFVEGTGITGTESDPTAGGSFNIVLHAVDAGNNKATSYDDNKTIGFTTTASDDAPDGTNSTIDGANITSGAVSNRTISFSNGTSANVAVVLYKEESAKTITAADDGGTPSGEASSAFTVDDAGLNNFLVNLTATAERNADFTGTNEVTARDDYENIITDFAANTTPVTMSVTSGAGTVTFTDGRGDAVLDLAADFSSGVADLTSIGFKYTGGAAGSKTIQASDGGSATGSDNVNITITPPEVSNPNTATDSHIDAQTGNPGLTVQCDINESAGTYQLNWGFNSTGTAGTYNASNNSGTISVSGGMLTYAIPSATMDDGVAYDYFFWWASGQDTEGNDVEGTPIVGTERRLLVNPTLTVSGTDYGQSMMPDTDDNVLLQLELSAEMSGATIRLTRVKFTKTSTSNAVSLDIDGFNLWDDTNGNGVLDGGESKVSGPIAGTLNPDFDGLTFDVNYGTSRYLLLTVDVSNSANGTKTLGMEVSSSSDMSVHESNDDIGGSFPTGTFDYSLPVELSSFTAFPDYGQIVLKWRTESEVNNLGFDLYRAISEEGPFEKITERRIKGAGTSASAVDYEYVDEKIEEGMTYFYKIESMDYDGTKYMKDIVVRVQELRAPKKFALSQNFPNPFNPETSIRYTLPYATAVRLVIYNSSGQLVRTLVDGAQSMGVHSVSWNGETDSGVRAASGIYFYKLQAGSFDQIRRMVFLR